MKNEEKSKGKDLAKNVLRVLRMIWSYDKRFIIGKFSISIVTSVLPIIASWYTAKFINTIIAGTFDSIFNPALIQIILIYLLVIVLNPIFNVIYQLLDRKYFISFGQYFDIKTTEKRGEIDIQKYEDPKFNDLLNKVNENYYKILNFTDFILFTFENVIQIVLGAVIMIQYAWWAPVVIAIGLIPDLFVEMKYGRQVWGIWDAKAETKRRYFENRRHFMSIGSLMELKIFGSKQSFLKRINHHIGEFNAEVAESERGRIKGKIFSTLFSYGMSASIIISLISSAVTKSIQIGTFTFFLSQINNLRGSVVNLFFNISRLYGDNLFIRDIFKLIDTETVLRNGEISLSEETPRIEFKDVSFRYPGTEKDILKNLNCIIEPGDKVAIVGVNGAGKTTFTKLIMRFYDATEGEIHIGNNKIQEINVESFYQKIGILSQEFAKYKMEVKEAIAVGNPGIPLDLEKVIEAAKLSGADEFIREWKNGYDTQLGKEFDGGVEPSVGQWQKLALARMFYRNPQIWVLDEPTASIDAIAEMQIFNTLENLPKDKTVILISHRFNTVKNADKIIVLDHGTIKEFGNHSELMDLNGLYKELFELQKGSYE